MTDWRPPRRNHNALVFSLSLTSSLPSRCFPLLAPFEMVAKSATTGCAVFLERVAARRLCSSDDRMRWNVFGAGSGAPDAAETLDVVAGGWDVKREEEAPGVAETFGGARCEGMWK